jgi:hypothetical protein
MPNFKFSLFIKQIFFPDTLKKQKLLRRKFTREQISNEKPLFFFEDRNWKADWNDSEKKTCMNFLLCMKYNILTNHFHNKCMKTLLFYQLSFF